MIGQNKLQNKLKNLKALPPLLLITGERGMGKRTAVAAIADKFNMPLFDFGTGVDEVRKALDTSYVVGFDCIYVCYDAEKMSNQSKNALLKVLEEPPQNAFFILTLKDLNSTLKTIQSRAWHFALENYTTKELKEIAAENDVRAGHDDFFELVRTPGEVIKFRDLNFNLFLKDVKDFFAKGVAGKFGECCAIIKKIKFKEDDADENKYDAELFLSALKKIIAQAEDITPAKKYVAVKLVTKTASNFKTSLNKQLMFETIAVGLG